MNAKQLLCETARRFETGEYEWTTGTLYRSETGARCAIGGLLKTAGFAPDDEGCPRTNAPLYPSEIAVRVALSDKRVNDLAELHLAIFTMARVAVPYTQGIQEAERVVVGLNDDATFEKMIDAMQIACKKA